MADDPLIGLTGVRQSDARELYRLSNIVTNKLCELTVDPKLIARRMRILAGWLQESADQISGLNHDDAAMLTVEKFWKARKAGARDD